MLSGCLQENCTVAETGACLLNNNPTTCPNRADKGDDSDLPEAENSIPPLKEPEKKAQFPLSQPLTPAQARGMMGGRYFHVVGILGAPDAGKTASLVSLYLLASRGQLTGFSYADSLTLMAFHEISQGARRWNEGKLPEQLTSHTELADDRIAGFLHLRLTPAGRKEAVDLLLPDLPGEWTTALTDNNRVDRFEFLRRADVVWLMVDGQQLSTPTTRQLALHRTKLLMQRLANLLVPAPRVILVVTRRDQGEPSQATLDDLHAEARVRGLCLEVRLIASFSDAETVRPGDGIAQLITSTTLPVGDVSAFWPDTDDTPLGTRAMMRFRKRQAI